MTNVAFLDLETTGLDPDRHDIWEIGVILRDADGDHEYLWRIEPDLAKADPNALRIGRFYERTAVHKHSALSALNNLATENVKPFWSGPAAVAHELARLMDGAHLVGAVPSFDAEFLKRFLPAYGQAYTAHYHLIDVEALAVGWAHGVFRGTADVLVQGKPHDALDEGPLLVTGLPWNSDTVSRSVGVDPDQFERHTALGDAKWARSLYDAVMSGRPVAAAMGEAARS